MKLLTEVSLPEYPFTLNHQSRVLMMGSCFTENIGRLMERYLFPVCINPFGVTYNPLSVKRSLEALMHKEAYEAKDLDQYNDLWFSFDHSTKFSASDQAQALASINLAFQEAKGALLKAGILILTWGTSWVYRQKKSDKLVCNCHKIPAKEFTRNRLSPQEIAAAYEGLFAELFAFNPNLNILLTISPVRHWKDGAHGNQLSKASLLLAGDILQQKYPKQLSYFPSYEIVMDELRDYRFYAKDMLHTSDQATWYIWEKFSDALMENKTQEIFKEVEAIHSLLEHRPLNVAEEAGKQLKNQIQERLEIARKKYPEIDWEKLQ
jgi:hypothetical protein